MIRDQQFTLIPSHRGLSKSTLRGLTCELAACDRCRWLSGSHGWHTPCEEDNAPSDTALWWRLDLREEIRDKLHFWAARTGWLKHAEQGNQHTAVLKLKATSSCSFVFPADRFLGSTNWSRQKNNDLEKKTEERNGKRYEVNVEFSAVWAA